AGHGGPGAHARVRGAQDPRLYGPARAHIHSWRGGGHRRTGRHSWHRAHLPGGLRVRGDVLDVLPGDRCLGLHGRAGAGGGIPVRSGGGRRARVPRGHHAHRFRIEDRRMKIPFSYIWRSLWARRLTTTLTVGGVALVVFVFAGVLMLSAGITATLVDTGSP